MSRDTHLVTIVVPVYGDWTSLKDCIDSLKQHVAAKHKVMLVNDCGPEVEQMEKGIKDSIKGFKNFSYYRNNKNLGFVGTCNRAVLELDKTKNDILLLNSDTKVTEDFLEEMSAALYESDDGGAVSPRSNNATITTVPLSMASQKGIDPNESYKIFQKIKDKLPRSNEVPTAHGFCMLICRSLVKKYGLFDPIFGKGYGEEVDFCQRILKQGYKSLICNRAFVFHMEARSFSMETKTKLLEKNNKIIWERYPDYRQSVQDYMTKAVAAENEVIERSGVKTSGKLSFSKRLLKKLLRH